MENGKQIHLKFSIVEQTYMRKVSLIRERKQ